MKRSLAKSFVLSLIACVLACTAIAPASVDVGTGIRYVITTGPIAECNTVCANRAQRLSLGRDRVVGGSF